MSHIDGSVFLCVSNSNPVILFQYQDLIRMEQKEFLTYARRIYELRDGKQFLWQIPSEMKRFSDECYAWKLKRISRYRVN
jgi:putative IMPACT (imprinted ancient) family translation regulator